MSVLGWKGREPTADLWTPHESVRLQQKVEQGSDGEGGEGSWGGVMGGG